MPNPKVGYGVSIEKAREWGLCVSTSRSKTFAGIEEPPLFDVGGGQSAACWLAEPALAAGERALPMAGVASGVLPGALPGAPIEA